jgi:hypothetical protein
MTTRKKRASKKPARSSPSPPKKTPQRGSKRKESNRPSNRRTAPRPLLPDNHDRELAEVVQKNPELGDMVAKLRADAEQRADDLRDKTGNLLGLFVTSQSAEVEAAHAKADNDRRANALRDIEEFIRALRTTIEPEPAIIAPLAEAIVRAAAFLRDSANGAAAARQDLADALLPAARAAVALTDLVNGPCAEGAPDAHKAARSVVERWPRTHHSNARLNTETDKLFRKWKIGAERPRKATAQDEPTPITTARDRTLDALCLLLPEILRGSYPVLPVLFDDNGKPIPPRTETGELADSYKTVAGFLVTIRHSKKKEPRTKALHDFLKANDAALTRLPKTSGIRAGYTATRKRLETEVARMDAPLGSEAKQGPPPPAWLRPVGPALSFARGTRTRSEILRRQGLNILATALAPVYARSMAEMEARESLKNVINLRFAITGKCKTGPDSAARDYVATHLDNLRLLHNLDEAKLRNITRAARAEAQDLLERA